MKLQLPQALRARLAELRAAAGANVPDMLMAAGAALISYGVWAIYPPAGFITGGVLLLVAGVIASRGTD